jgi:antirestriction protein
VSVKKCAIYHQWTEYSCSLRARFVGCSWHQFCDEHYITCYITCSVRVVCTRLNEAFYYVCRTSLRADVNDLKRHASTKIHKQQAAKPGKKSTILNYATTSGTTSFNKEQKETDMNLAVYIAYHRCIRSVDDLDEILRKIGTSKGSRLENLRLHRTKCSMLIKNVIAPALLKEIVNMSYKCQLYPIHTVAT